MNILVLELDPISAEITGEGQTTLNLSKEWLNEGHNITIIAPRNWCDFTSFEETFKKEHILEVKPSSEKKSVVKVTAIWIIRLFQSIRYIIKLDRVKNLDLVFACGNVSCIAAYVAKTFNYSRYKRVPIIVVPFYHTTPHEAVYQKRDIKYLQHIALISALSFAARKLQAYFFTESTLTAKMLNKNFKIPMRKILAIGGGVDGEFVHKIKQTFFPRKMFDACFIGRIHPSKGVFDLVSCWNTVRLKIPEAKLAIIGGGYPQYQGKLKKMIKELSLSENIVLCGSVSNQDKFKILMRSKFLVHPAYEECIPLTFFEAAIVDVPIITYYLPTYENVREILIPVKKGDVELLTNTLVKRILSYDANIEVFYPLIEKEKELAKKHTWKYIASSFVNLTVNRNAYYDSAT